MREDPAPADAAECLTTLLTKRRSCRAFLPASVPRETIARILAMAQRTPSWCNTQPWQVIVTSGAGTERFRAGLLSHAAIVTTDEAQGAYGAIDCGAYVNNFMLSARSLGVASIAQAAIARQAKFVRAHFNLAPDRQLLCGISFGFEDADHPANKFRTSRASLKEAVDWVES